MLRQRAAEFCQQPRFEIGTRPGLGALTPETIAATNGVAQPHTSVITPARIELQGPDLKQNPLDNTSLWLVCAAH